MSAPMEIMQCETCHKPPMECLCPQADWENSPYQFPNRPAATSSTSVTTYTSKPGGKRVF